MKDEIEIDFLKERNDLSNCLLTMQRRSKDIGRDEELLDQYQTKILKLFDQLTLMIKTLTIENHNLKDKIIKIEGLTVPVR
jgi:hypothetical protein